jgi:hypothetical protein
MLRVFLAAAFLLFVGLGHSEESRPREAEGKTDAPQQNNQPSGQAQTVTPPSSAIPDKPLAPIINVYTGKHAGEESHCPQPKDWKEWGSLAWCRTWEWVDAERVIAIFTVILGVATWRLWRVTGKLVEGAEETAQRQLRAYVGIDSIELDCPSLKTIQEDRYVPQTTGPGTAFKDFTRVKIRNYGQTPAYQTELWAGWVGLEPFLAPPPPDYDFTIPPKDRIIPMVNVVVSRQTLHRDQMDITKTAIPDIRFLYRATAKQGMAFYYGRIDYEDSFGRRWRTHFCYGYEPWHHDGPRFVAFERNNYEEQIK